MMLFCAGGLYFDASRKSAREITVILRNMLENQYARL